MYAIQPVEEVKNKTGTSQVGAISIKGSKSAEFLKL